MKKLLNVTLSGTNLSFNSDGSVTDPTGKQTGQWSTQSGSRTNGIVYTATGAAPASLTSQLAFNVNNQLTVQVTGGTGVTAMAAPSTIEGFIYVEDNQDIVYYAIENDDPNQPSFAFYLYGAVAIDPGKNVLTIAIAGAATPLSIVGFPSGGNTALSTSRADNALDQIEFSAQTHNPLAGGAAVDIPATIALTGKWDVQNGQMVFGLTYDTTGMPTLAVSIAANIKGVTAGFEFYSTGGDNRLLFAISGQIKGTDQNGNWSLSIGYAQNLLTATGQLQDTIVTPGGSFAISGSFSITKGGNAPLTFAVQVQATWKLDNGQFNLVVSSTGGNSYSLQLTGNLKIDGNWNITFSVTAGSAAGTTFNITIGYAPPGSAWNAKFSLYCANNKIQFSLSMTVTLTYVDGQMLPAAAGTAPAKAVS